MTVSLLMRDPATDAMGAAAATGSLCVGGWVLRGDARAGLSASQGAAPSPFWGEDVLDRMRAGSPADHAVRAVTDADAGRAARQLTALDLTGQSGVFTGAQNDPWRGARQAPDIVASGNLLAGGEVLDALIDGLVSARGALPERLIAALSAARAAGGDRRGFLSAALLVVRPDAPPLTLRIDHDADDPIAALEALLAQTRQPDYAAWLDTVPTLRDPQRGAV